MARPLRIEGAGLWYHVMCRGNAGQRVFRDTRDYTAFLERLGTVSSAFHVEVHAYALMTNHVHLFLRTREANLSRFMQRLLGGYTQWFNARHETYGHLFQGRYKALLVDKSAYGAAVSRYIHLNPVRTSSMEKLPVQQRQARLRDYRWSSYRAMIGLAEPHEWLVTKGTLAGWGATVREQQEQYAAFVEQGLIEDVEDPTERATAQSILGRDRFVDRVRRIVNARKQTDHDSEGSRRQLSATPLETVLERVARAYHVTPGELTKTRMGQHGHEARLVAMWLAREQCSALLTARQIGKAMGGVSGAAVIVAHRRVQDMIRRDKRLARRVRQLL